MRGVLINRLAVRAISNRLSAILNSGNESSISDAIVRGRHAKPASILGQSIGIIRVREQVAIAARSKLNVLIMGETGTGKELVAREIHRLSPRNGKELVSHNCSVIPRDLFENEFFGHHRGAFTGAGEDHIGLLVEAHESHLFLDELEAMSSEHQVKLLRVMEDGMVRRVGGRTTQEVDVRYLAATNQDPKQLLRAGQLRQDLYYRLKGHVINLPPLRQRPEDIVCLARHFLKEAASALTEDAIKVLQAYHWPGNVRELKQLVLAARDLAFAAREHRILPGHLAICEPEFAAAVKHASDLQTLSLDEGERAILERAIHEAGGKLRLAADMLGIDRTTLWRKRQKYGIV
jgi:transcriptional regulator with PAS, ATPase and Fis domain